MIAVEESHCETNSMGGLVKGLGLVGLCVTALIVMRLVASSYQSTTPAIQDAENAAEQVEGSTQQVEDMMQKVEDATTELEEVEMPSTEAPAE